MKRWIAGVVFVTAVLSAASELAINKSYPAARTGQNLTASSHQEPIDVFLIAGQSNASGIPDNAIGSPSVPAGKVLQFYKNTLIDADDPVGNAKLGSAWPEFGIVYRQATGRRVLFVPAAIPGSSMTASADFFNQGHWDSTGRLFTAALAASDAAIRRAGPSARFAGVLWDQGENDAMGINRHFETAGDYKRSLADLIQRFRAHFGANMPFFIFQTGVTVGADPSGFGVVRAVQRDVSENTANAPIVFKDAVTFPSRGLMAKSRAHYTQDGYNEMGRKGAQGVVTWERRNNPRGR